jgi:hypothetical protein
VSTGAGNGPVAVRARRRFDRLRGEALAALADGTTARRLAEGGGAVPGGWCVSTIARLAVNDPDTLPALAGVQQALPAAGPARPYPAGSLHVSLLGATQREASPDFAAERLDRVVEAVHKTVAGVAPAAVHLGRLNLLGNQWFVEVTPVDETWSALRRALVAPFEALGEEPIAYPDTEPMHLNVARLEGLTDPDRAAALLDAPPDLDRAVVLRAIEVVVTDFLVSPEALRVLDTVTLA